MRSNTKKILSALVAATLLMSAVPAYATGETWAAPTNLTVVAEDASNPQLVVDATGLRTAIWEDQRVNETVIRSSTSVDGANWSTPVNVSSLGTIADSSQLVVDFSGRATAIWIEEGSIRRVVSSYRQLDGSWSTPDYISDPDVAAYDPAVKVDSRGDVTAVWTAQVGSIYSIASNSRSQAGIWSVQEYLSALGDDAASARLALGPDDKVTAVWSVLDGSVYAVEYASRIHGQPWSSPVLIPTASSASSPQVAIGSDGNAIVAWVASNIGQSGAHGIQWIELNSNPVVRNLTHGLLDYGSLEIAAGSAGSLTVVWEGYDGTSNTIQSASYANSVTTDVVDVSADYSQRPKLAIDSNGLVKAVWQHTEGSQNVVQASILQNGSWSNEVDLSAPGEDAVSPQIVTDADGLSTVVWKDDTGDRGMVKSRTSAGSGPWSDTFNVFPVGTNSSEPQIAVDGNGLATVVFNSMEGGVSTVKVRTRQRAGSWSTSQTISLSGLASSSPSIAVSASGLVVAVWIVEAGGVQFIQSSRFLNGGGWSNPETISDDLFSVSELKVVVDSSGRVTALWIAEQDSGPDQIQASTQLGDSNWLAPETIAESQNAQSAQLTLGSSGLTLATWVSNDGSNYIIESSTSRNGETWSEPVNASPLASRAGSPQITADSNGSFLAVWQSYPDVNSSVIRTSSSQNGETWTFSEPISAINVVAINPLVRVDHNGIATAVWITNDSDRRIQSSTSSDRITWSTPRTIYDGGLNPSSPQLAVDSEGLVTAVWKATRSGLDVILSNTSLAGSQWTTPVAVSAPSGSVDLPQITVDEFGLVTAVWVNDGLGSSVIQTSSIQNPTSTPNVDDNSDSDSDSGSGSGSGEAPAPTTSDNTVRVVERPIPSFSFESRPVVSANGQSLTLNGQNLAAVSSIKIGGKEAKITKSSADELVIEVPAGTEGNPDLVIVSESGTFTMQGLIQVMKPYADKRTVTIPGLSGGRPTKAAMSAIKASYLKSAPANIVSCVATVAINASSKQVALAKKSAKAACREMSEFSSFINTVDVQVIKTGKAGSKQKLAVTFDRTLTGK